VAFVHNVGQILHISSKYTNQNEWREILNIAFISAIYRDFGDI